jgi:hypothetical protein
LSKDNIHLQHDLRGFGSRLDSFLDGVERQEKTRATEERSQQFETIRPSKQAARNLSSGASGDAIRAVTSQTQNRS